MDKTITSKKFCKNCKFYKALYTKEKTRFKTVTGQCVKEIAAGKRPRTHPQYDCCEFWEQSDSADEQNKSIREVIFTMQTQLTQILELLENDD